MGKRSIRWACALVASVATIVGLVVTNVVFSTDASAAKTVYQTARENTAIKVLAKNLSECFANAQQTVDLSSNNTYRYDGSGFWVNPDMQVYYPNALAGKTGSEESSNCAKMIKGWNSNWIVKLFTSNGDYVGVKQGLKLPGDFKTYEERLTSMDTLKAYLEGTGYTKESQSVSALDGYKCVYFHMGLNQAAVSNNIILGPKDGNLNLVSKETYCVPVKSNGTTIDVDKDFKIVATDELGDVGLDRDSSGRHLMGLTSTKRNDFKIASGIDGFNRNYYFLVTIFEVDPQWTAVDSLGNDIIPGSERIVEIVNYADDSICNVTTIGLKKRCSVVPGKLQKSYIVVSFDNFKTFFKDYISKLQINKYSPYNLFSSVEVKELNPKQATAKYEKTNDEKVFIGYFFEYAKQAEANGYAKMNDSEQYMFYYDILKNYFGSGNTYLYESKDNLSGDPIKVLWLNESGNSFVERYISMNTDKTACALSNNTWPGKNCGSNKKDWKYFANQLASFSEDALLAAFNDVKPLDDDYSNDVEDDGSNESKSDCYSGAQSLGWILCPVMSFLGDATDKLYENFIERALIVNPELLTEGLDGNNSTKQAWETFRGFANIAFSIILLLIIFSQVTGYGIDNYGIKKILPKLIIAAVLINFSYYICQFLVDLSNIAGTGLRALLENSVSGMNITASSIEGGAITTGSIVATGISAVSILAALVGVVVTLGENPAMLLPVLLFLLSVFISILFLFIILAARQVATICFVVISPIMFACMILPNTQKAYDKWVKMGWGLLMVFPICGLLVGGGNFVSKLLLVANTGERGSLSFFGAFVAMASSIAPIFFIPEVVSNAMNVLPGVLGGLANKINGMGKGLNRFSQGAIRGSEAYKNAQRMGLERRTRLKAGLDTSGQLTERGKRRAERAKRFGKFATKNQAAYVAAAKKNFSAAEEAGAQLTNVLSKDAIAKYGGNAEEYYKEEFRKASEKGDISAMNSVLAAATSSGYLKDKQVAAIVREFADSHLKDGFKDDATRAAWLRDTASKYGSGFLATDMELKQWMMNSGMKNGGKMDLGKYGDYAREAPINNEDIKPEDLLKLSGSSLAALISQGTIDQGMAQRVMAMNANMSSDKRIMLGALAGGMVGNGVDIDGLKAFSQAFANNNSPNLDDPHLIKDDAVRASAKAIAGSMGADVSTLVARWTAPTAQRTTVVQEFFSDQEKQDRPVEVSIKGDTSAAEGVSYGISHSAPTPTQSLGPAPSPTPTPTPTPTSGPGKNTPTPTSGPGNPTR